VINFITMVGIAHYGMEARDEKGQGWGRFYKTWHQ
jgi:hypothetical protein